VCFTATHPVGLTVNYNLLNHKTHSLEAILLLSILPGCVIIYLVHSVNQADLSNSKDHLKIPHKFECLSSYLDMDKKMKTGPNYWVLQLQAPDTCSHMETY